MQGMTVALSPAGIAQLSQHASFVNVSGFKLADRTIPFTAFSKTLSRSFILYTDISVSLTNGGLSNFNPVVASVSQQKAGVFVFHLNAGNFQADYNWSENYSYTTVTLPDPNDPNSQGSTEGPYPGNGSFTYTPGMGSLQSNVTSQFQFDANKQEWDFIVTNIQTTPGTPSPNIPADSVVQNEVTDLCFKSHVSDVTAQSFATINFGPVMEQSVGSCIASIPDSGQLTPDIKFTFALGDSGLAFPDDSGMAMGVTGVTTYKNQTYPINPPTGLPVPPVPDGYHVQMYVSDYLINGLYWAFALDGKLDVTVTPEDLIDPNILKVRTWTSSIRGLMRYQSLSMNIQVNVPRDTPPTVTFGDVYVFDANAMARLKQAVPSSIYDLVSSGLQASVYPTKGLLEDDLTNIYTVPSQYFLQFETAAQTIGAAVTHNLQFIVTIEGAPPINGAAPFMEFTVNRMDVLEKLVLGVSNAAQTLQFAFLAGTNSVSVTFNQSNFLDKNDIYNFGTEIWPQAAEGPYDAALQYMGSHGVPMPIMQGFKFLFDQAQLNIEKTSGGTGFISVLADVEFKG